MKTIFDKWPLEIRAGGTVTIDLPQTFGLADSLFMLVHNALHQNLTVTLTANDGREITQVFSLHSFPSILVFKQTTQEEEYTKASFTSFNDFAGSITYRIKNPAMMMASYRSS